ncbi:phage holin [Liquorilactobacillus ghanensis]|uniref:phage holin n=1 Tax=Liquorilactobacillus ghanensis TaxID=399370 RepID=UPI0039E73CF6
MNDLLSTIYPALGTIFVAIVGYAAKEVTSKVKNQALLQSIESLAKDAVVLAEKSGAVNYLTGSQKFKQAENYVIAELEKLGFKNVSNDTIKGGVEKAYALLKSDIEADYDQAKQPKLSDSLKVDENGDVIAK